ncbi:MAG: DUF3014 domain-containing protein [Nitrosomonadales bacterium]|nr:DUF3014 domain-containing protein [Nitrosomonadales bacterium]
MKMNLRMTVAAIIILLCSVAGYVYWQASQPGPAPVQAPPPPLPPEPEVRQVLEAPPEAPALPTLDESDSYLLKALSGLIGNPSLMEYLITERLIRNIVATVDNLPRKEVSMRVIPVKRVPGSFIVAGTEGDWRIGPNNAVRYAPYVKIAAAVDAKQLVELYIRLYPLFQQAYEELGYPKRYFNDRLIVALDDLIAAPDIAEPVKLVRPKVFYLYADPDLENRSIGQRILMRMGGNNRTNIKDRLQEIKQELLLHMHEQKVENPA